MRWIAIALVSGLLGFFAISCGSSQIDTSESRHESIAAKSGLYCDYVQQKGRMDEFELELNSQVAAHCGHGRIPSLTQYIVGEIRGIMFCCTREPATEARPTALPSPTPSALPSPRVPLRRAPVARPSPQPAQRKSKLPPAQKPMIAPRTAPAPAPAATTPAPTPAATAPAQRPDLEPATAPSP